MVVGLFLVSFLLALAVSYAVSEICKETVEPILNRFLARNVSMWAAKYLQLAVVLVGVSNGTRVRLLEDYMGAPSWNKPELVSQLTPELWAIALYHTFIDALFGIVWLVIVFMFLAWAAVMFLRRSNMRGLLANRGQIGHADMHEQVKPIR